MGKSKHIVDPLPAELLPPKSSLELLREHVERLTASGVRQKDISLSCGFGDNFVSMLKKGTPLPMGRIIELARALRLSPQERFELLDTRIRELHGRNADLCLGALSEWAAEMFAPAGDEAVLVALWQKATAPAPGLVAGLLQRPEIANKVHAVLDDIVQAELQASFEESQIP